MKKICVSFLLLLVKFSLLAQSTAEENSFAKSIDFLPPAPNAAAIAKAGFFSLNKNTGSPNINIPLLNAKGKNLAAIISLTYASNGIKVDEMASRVGIGWSLNAGGAVSRIIKGYPDEGHIRVSPWVPLGENVKSAKFCALVTQNSNKHTGYDTEPDIFTFNCNGQSGSFMLNSKMEAVQIPYGNFKIEVKFGEHQPWNVKIINTEGITFYFGGEFAVENSKQVNSCAKGGFGTYNAYFPTSWYLKKIVANNGEVIEFDYVPINYSYTSGISETISQYGLPLYGSDCPPDKPINDPIVIADYTIGCKISQVIQGVILHKIRTQYASITFGYLNRPDIEDKLIEEIVLRDETLNSRIIKNYFFVYDFISSSQSQFDNQYTEINIIPYLTKIIERKENNEYSFKYIEPEVRCNRLAFSQDHWGFFNGKINQTLIAQPPSIDERDLIRPLPNANANREPDFNFAVKGMLNKIVYPTGGIDSIIYEPNSIATPIKDGILTKYTCSVTGVGIDFYNTIYKDIPFTFDTKQDIKIETTSTCTTCSDNSLHYQGSIQVKRLDGFTVYNEVFFLTTNVPKKITLYDLEPGSYIIKIMARTSLNTTTATINYYPKLTDLGFTNKIVGGIRVKKILNGNKNEFPTIKNYFYGELDNLNLSSCKEFTEPLYGKKYKLRYTYPITQNIEPYGNLPAMELLIGYNYCYRDCYGMYSSTLSNLFNYQGNTVSYQSVVESYGDNFENGGIQTTYNTSRDILGVPAWGSVVFNGPTTNYSIFKNGKVSEENVLKKSPINGLVKIKQNINKYIVNTNFSNSITAYQVIDKYNVPPLNSDTITGISNMPLIPDFMESFDVIKYTIESPWAVLAEVESINYDEEGLNPQSNTVKYFYDNNLHQQVTKTETKDSKGNIISTYFFYPHDFAASNTLMQQMVEKNIISPLINSKKQKNNQLLVESISNYKIWEGNNIEISSISRAVNGNRLEVQGTINERDKFSNILQYTAKDEIINSILWGYMGKYPVAKIVGLAYSTVLEALTNRIAFEQFQQLNGNDLLSVLQQLRTDLPSQTMIITYTYNFDIGVETITDINGKTNTYIYDVNDRLTQIKDQNNNIVKSFNYTNAGSDITNTYKLFYNTPQSITLSCGPCLHEGTIGKSITYNILEKQYFSTTSTEDANNKAIQDITLNGQSYVNSVGYCGNDDAVCIGAAYKKIGCKCEVGIKICISSRIANAGEPGYYNTYKYKWSDNTVSDTFIEFSLNDCQPIAY